MLKKSWLAALLGAAAMTVAACAPPLLGGSDDDTATEETQAPGNDSEGTSEGGDTDEPVDQAELPEIDLPDGMTEEEADAMVASAITGDVPPEVEACVGRALLGEPTVLADILLAGDDFVVTDLAFDDQVRMAEITIDCSGPDLIGEFLAQGFTEGFADASGTVEPPPPAMIDCFTDRFGQADGPLVMVGFFAVGEDMVPDPSAQGPLVDTLTDCIPGSYLAGAALGEFAADPTLAAATDTACINTAFDDDPEALRPMWEAFVANPNSDGSDLPPEVMTAIAAPLFECISFGSVLDQELGGALSASSIACIDEQVAASGLLEELVSGAEPSEDALFAILIECLTPEELSQLANA